MMIGTAMIQARVCSRRPTSADSRKPAIGRTSSRVTRSSSVVIWLAPDYSRMLAYSSTSGVRRLR